MSLSATQVAQARLAIGDAMGATVTVETYEGAGAHGPVRAASVDVVCNVHAARRLVRNSDGDEVISETTLHVASADEAKFTPESRVTVGGRVSTVLAVGPKTYKAQLTYVEVACR